MKDYKYIKACLKMVYFFAGERKKAMSITGPRTLNYFCVTVAKTFPTVSCVIIVFTSEEIDDKVSDCLHIMCFPISWIAS